MTEASAGNGSPSGSSTSDAERALEAWPPRWLLYFFAVVVVLVLAANVLIAVARFSDAATASDTRAIAAHFDCQARVTAERQELRDQRDNTLDRIVVLSGSGNRAESAALIPTLESYVKRIDKLPKLDDVIARECPAP